jgi:hypothetical protein
VYESFFKAMNWKQIGAISEGGHEFPNYHLLLQEHLQHSGISVVVKRRLVRNFSLNELDVSQIFADLRAQNVRVIIADVFVFAARAVMCEAWRQVGLINDKKFVHSLWVTGSIPLSTANNTNVFSKTLKHLG